MFLLFSKEYWSRYNIMLYSVGTIRNKGNDGVFVVDVAAVAHLTSGQTSKTALLHVQYRTQYSALGAWNLYITSYS
jgi:hypothetical protein